ncbi:hypothetical protein LSH36_631g01008 [Paralvinella palmiformis]|uniref:Uncharacterized protein n=1 Tax=Paralvinella palmiformis TaxID=53620 RepID=A0AAD9MW67_9ANNE|nr:hypothetical protein LSH36_631g01008 [Paralvinella palmiformis]
MYAPANVYAIANDHDYQDKSPGDMFLQSIHVTAITHDEQESIEIKDSRTRNQQVLEGRTFVAFACINVWENLHCNIQNRFPQTGRVTDSI